MINTEAYYQISEEVSSKGATLVAVSKTKPVAEILELYKLGQRDFGENYVQELVEKVAQLPADIRWHFIGHLQSNKVKYIAPFVHLIHSVDNQKLAKEINKQAAKQNRVIDCLLQVYIAEEETKFGLNENETELLINWIQNDTHEWDHISLKGLMGMASNTVAEETVKTEFKFLKQLFDKHFLSSTKKKESATLSMGMSGDYKIALEEGSNMVRIGSLLFGARN